MATLTIPITLDAYLSSGTNANQNFGNATTMPIGTVLAPLSQSIFNRGLLRTLVSGLPAGAVITAAVLTLTHNGGGGVIPEACQFSLRSSARNNWVGPQVTWNSFATGQSWTTPGGDLGGNGLASVTISSSLEHLVFSGDGLLAAVWEAVALHGGQLDLFCIGPEIAGASRFQTVYSSDAADPAVRPTLEITYFVPVLSIEDNGDGTGAVATISGSDPAGTNLVYVGQWGGGVGGATFTLGGSRVGDGSVTLSLTPGYYWAYALMLGSGPSGMTYFRATEEESSVHYACLQATQAVIQSLALEGVSNGSVRVRKLPVTPDKESSDYPLILVTGYLPESMVGGTNLRDDVGYPVTVSIIEKDNSSLTANYERNLLWRQRIARACRRQRPAGVDEVYDCILEPGAVVLPGPWFDQTYHSSFVLRYLSREPRGM